tara:strand:+ start:213 stop:515 length:303 start_codon:yes stop_codon:yes gene_type:complete
MAFKMKAFPYAGKSPAKKKDGYHKMPDGSMMKDSSMKQKVDDDGMAAEAAREDALMKDIARLRKMKRDVIHLEGERKKALQTKIDSLDAYVKNPHSVKKP